MTTTRAPSVQRRRIWPVLVALAGVASASLAVAAQSGPASAPVGHAPVAAKKKAPAVPVKLVDINSATRAQLKTLPGVGDGEADKIIAGRPYLTKAELVTKKVMPTGPYLSLKDRVVAMQKSKPKGKS